MGPEILFILALPAFFFLAAFLFVSRAFLRNVLSKDKALRTQDELIH